jgi:hypothetical protein
MARQLCYHAAITSATRVAVVSLLVIQEPDGS